MRASLLAAAVVILGAIASGESKDQALLRKAQEQIAQLQAQHDADAKKNADLTGKLAGLQVGQRNQKASIAETADLVETGRGEAAAAATVTASAIESLRLELGKSVEEAKKAEANAKTERAKTEAVLIQAKSEGIKSLIWQISQLGGILLVPLVTYWVAKLARQDIKALTERHEVSLKAVEVAVGDTKTTIEQLEKNTNNKMDKLLETTSEAQYAKGLKQGAADAKS